MNRTERVWLGYARTGGRVYISRADLKASICMLGSSSNETATAIALSCHEAGLKTLVLDLDGDQSAKISGYIPAYSPSYFLYDAMKMNESNPDFHAQLIASAYATALDLSFEQEAVLGNVCQVLASDAGVASPTALAVQIGGDQEGTSVTKLRGRLNSLNSLNVVGDQDVLQKLASRSSILDFRESLTLETAEVGAALVIAKLLALLRQEDAKGPDVLILLAANRLFKSRPIFRQNLRLLSTFIAADVARILASEQVYGLDERFTDTAATKILSSEVWNDSKHEEVMAPSMRMLRNSGRGFEAAFVPREFERKTGSATRGAAPTGETTDVTMAIVETVASFQEPTRGSVAAFVSPNHSPDQVEREIDRLVNEGYLSVEAKDLKKNAPHSTLKLTVKGQGLLTGNGT